MKKLYLDCGMGAAGDMLAAALYELLDEKDKQAFMDQINTIAPSGVSVSVRPETKCGITGAHFTVMINGEEEHTADVAADAHEHTHEHTHGHTHEHGHTHHFHGSGHHNQRTMADVESIINGFSGISDDARRDIAEVYKVIAAAESFVHGEEVSEIHFHEVGMMDAIIDITSVCVLMDMLQPDEVYASPVRVGKGYVKCAHGVLPVPAPATAAILEGVPTYAGDIEAELCTPTGAALLKYFVKEFGDQPPMSEVKVGYGMGTKDFGVCNCVKAFIG